MVRRWEGFEAGASSYFSTAFPILPSHRFENIPHWRNANPSANVDLTVKYLFSLLFCIALLGCSKGPAQVRVQNLTNHALAEVTVEDISFGKLPAGDYSTTKEIAVLNHEPSVLTRDADGNIQSRRVFHDPKGPVGAGKFLVTLTLNLQGVLQVQVTRDDWRKIFSR